MKKVLTGIIGVMMALSQLAQAEFHNPPQPQKTIENQLHSAKSLIKRLLPKHADQIVVEALNSPADKDLFEIESVDGKIVLRGNKGVSIASALNWYLKYTCNCQIAWSGDQLNLPEKLPVVEKLTRKKSPYKFRSYLNYCTFNYTMSWWDWERWEREIDWMALNGITMPLMAVGQEATWLATFKRYGLTDEEMQKFFVGPAYFAWHWMTNIDSIGGPLPMSWIESHRALGQQILKRQRELGMTPILQGFTGHVPKAFLDKHPKVKAAQEKSWSLKSPGTWQMDPLDPLFAELGTAFIEEQTKIFGTDHLYTADPFHEGHPPVEGEKYLNDVGKAIFKTMTSADKEAIWVKQSWSFREAILAPIPTERFIILDLNGARTWNKKTPFNGRSTAWGTLYNLGGRRYLTGSLTGLLGRCGQVDKQAKNVDGLGSFDECIEWNPVVFDALYENTWRDDTPDPQQWVKEYARRRYGFKAEELEKAWALLLKNVYSRGSWYGAPLSAKPCVSLICDSPCGGSTSFPGDNRELIEAWKLLLAQSENCKDAPGYRYDLVDFGNQILNNYATSLHQRLIRSFKDADKDAFEKAGAEIMELFTDLEELTGTHEMFMLGKWIKDARNCGTTKAEKDLYEFNAKSLISVWNDEYTARISDYSTRGWNGMYSGLYAKRWGDFIEMLKGKFAKGEHDYSDHKMKRVFGRPHFAPDLPFYKDQLAFEAKWVRSHENYPSEPIGDTIAVSTKLVEKYYPRIVNSYKLAKAGNYPPNQTYRYKKPKLVVKKSNITSGKPVEINGGTERADLVPELAVDGIIDKNRHWAAKKGGEDGRWLKVDLGENTMIDGATVWTYWDNKRYYQYNIEISTDGLEWLKVADFSKNKKAATEKGYKHKFTEVSARYVRINFLKNSSNNSFHLVEFHVDEVK